MLRLLTVAILSMSCSLLAGCDTKRELHSVRPDRENPERMVCEAAPDRPAIPATYEIDWTAVQTVAQARSEHEAYVRSILARNAVISGYIVEIEGRLFVCSNNAQFWRDYWKAMPEAE